MKMISSMQRVQRFSQALVGDLDLMLLIHHVYHQSQSQSQNYFISLVHIVYS